MLWQKSAMRPFQGQFSSKIYETNTSSSAPQNHAAPGMAPGISGSSLRLGNEGGSLGSNLKGLCAPMLCGGCKRKYQKELQLSDLSRRNGDSVTRARRVAQLGIVY